MLSRHPSRCRFPHGHTRRIELVVSSVGLDENGMVCDFKALKLAVGELIDSLDHAMVMNSEDPALAAMREVLGQHRRGGEADRLIVLEGQEPTTEAMARLIYEHLASRVSSGEPLVDAGGTQYRLPAGLMVERVRVSETSTSWAEYGV